MRGNRKALRPAVDHGRYRIAHVALLLQCTAVAALGGVALAWSMANVRFGAEGMPLFGLTVTPWHGGLLIATGIIGVVACMSRRATVVFGALALVGWTVLTVVSEVGTYEHAPGVLGFDETDTLFDATMAVYDLAVCIALASVVLPTMRRAWQPAPRLEKSPAASTAQ